MNKSVIQSDKLNKIVYACCLLLYFSALVYLFYNQLVYSGTGIYESDTAVHVEFAVKDRYFYSLSSFVYAFLDLLPGINVTVSVMLSALTVGSVCLTKKLLVILFERNTLSPDEAVLNILSFSLNLSIGFYISFVNKAHYIGYQSGNMWHNSTYIFMRFFALLTLIYYLKINDTYKDGFSLKEWLFFSFLLAVTTGFKPSFLTVFAPFLLIKLLYDWTCHTKFINVFKLGTTVFPAIFVMALESMVLFPGEGDSGYMIAPFKALSMRGNHPKVSLILSILFPLCVLAFNIKDIFKDKLYLGGLIIWFIGFMEVFLLVETGSRSQDGNFFWGYSISLFIWFIISAVKAYKTYTQSESCYTIYIIIIQGLILGWHVISGIWYFVLLLQGYTYFI